MSCQQIDMEIVHPARQEVQKTLTGMNASEHMLLSQRLNCPLAANTPPTIFFSDNSLLHSNL